jgi:hypothetical protein
MDMKTQLATNTAKEPYPDILGPFKDRGHQNGVVIRHATSWRSGATPVEWT